MFCEGYYSQAIEILGSVVRSDDHGMAISIVRYEFDNRQAVVATGLSSAPTPDQRDIAGRPNS